MKVEKFLAGMPCLEEVDGYILGLKIQIKNPDALGGYKPQYETLSNDVLGQIEAYRRRLLQGKETPAPTALDRKWVYQQGRKPIPNRNKGPA